MFFFPEEDKDTDLVIESIEELTLMSKSGPKSKHDDCLDCDSMMGVMPIFRPSHTPTLVKSQEGVWEYPVMPGDTDGGYANYVV